MVQQTLATDFRIVLNVVSYICLILAAMVAVQPTPRRLPEIAGGQQPA